MPESDRLHIHARNVALTLSLMAAGLGVAHLVTVYFRRVHGFDYVMGLGPLFDFVRENNFPSYFSALLLLAAAGLLAIIGTSTVGAIRRYRFYWLFLARDFAFLSFDEALAIHENLMRPTRERFQTTGMLYAAWIIPYGAALLALSFIYLRWFIALPAVTRWRFSYCSMPVLNRRYCIGGCQRSGVGEVRVPYARA